MGKKMGSLKHSFPLDFCTYEVWEVEISLLVLAIRCLRCIGIFVLASPGKPSPFSVTWTEKNPAKIQKEKEIRS